MIGTVALSLSGPGFSLEWTHSVENIAWREQWRVTEAGLDLARASVKGSGAGMEPGADAVLRDGWWSWDPDLPPQAELRLAASGATGAGWRLCDGKACREIGAEPGESVLLRPCSAPSPTKNPPR
ncbi:DUF1850 domain-containing protein [Paracoccus isoporae]